MFRRRFIERLRAFTSDSTYDPTHLQRLANKFREGMAKAIGVPPEWIREDVVQRWVENYVKAFVKPEYWGMVFQSPGEYEMEWLGYELGEIIKDMIKKKVDNLPPAIKSYVKRVSETTGNPEHLVLMSEPVINYARQFGCKIW